MIRFVMNSIMFVMTVFLMSCSNFDVFGGGDVAISPSPLVDFDETVEFDIKWDISMPTSPPYYSISIVKNQICDGGESQLQSIDFETGVVVSEFSVPSILFSGFSCDDEHWAVADLEGYLHLYDSSGDVLWNRWLGATVIGTPIIVKDRVFIMSADGRVIAFALTSGQEVWSYRSNVPPVRIQAYGGLTSLDGVLYAPMHNGKLIALSEEDGVDQWEIDLAVLTSDNDIASVVHVLPIAVAGDLVCSAAFRGTISCVNFDGNIVWSKPFSTTDPISAGSETVFAADEDGALYAFSANTGDVLWTETILKHRGPLTLMAYREGVVVGDAFGYLHVFSRLSGGLLGRLRADSTPILSVFPDASGDFLLRTSGGKLMRFAIVSQN